MNDYEREGVIKGEALILQTLESKLGVSISRVSLERVNFDEKNNLYTLNDYGHVISLRIKNFDDLYGDGPLGRITEEICSLSSLEYLYLIGQNISYIHGRIKNLKKLVILDLWANPVVKIPHEILELNNLKAFYLSGSNSILPHINLLPYMKDIKFEKTLEIGEIWQLIQTDLNEKEQAEREKLTKKFNEQREQPTVIYPPKEILNTLLIKSRNFEYVILWMLGNNFVCGWFDLKSNPLNISRATLSKYLTILTHKFYTCKVSKGYYMITVSGRKRLQELEKSIINKE